MPSPEQLPGQPADQPASNSGGSSNALLAVALLAAVAVIVGCAVLIASASDSSGSITIAGPPAEAPPTPNAPTTTPDREPARSGTDPDITGRSLPTFDDGIDQADDPAIGMAIPRISGVDYDGNPVVIAPGAPQLIVVMAHWCPHCQREIPSIVGWNDDDAVPDDVDIVGISTAVDEIRGNYPPPSWLERERWPFPVLADGPGSTTLEALGASGFPTIIAVGRDGRVALRSSGESTRSDFDDLIEAARRGAAI